MVDFFIGLCVGIFLGGGTILALVLSGGIEEPKE